MDKNAAEAVSICIALRTISDRRANSKATVGVSKKRKQSQLQKQRIQVDKTQCEAQALMNSSPPSHRKNHSKLANVLQ